jgi:thiol-disulfide isomerase/thioredoxin
MKKWIAGVWLSVLMIIIAGFFWFNQLVYSMPTPVPNHYLNVKNGAKINISSKLNLGHDKPIFLHFFNPDCPCSRFNIAQFKALVKSYGDSLNFAVIVMSDKPFVEKDIQERFGLTIPIFKDDGIATSCGVYSTPQAVLLKSDNTLFYRGNYNKSRYCTDEKTSYAKLAIEAIVSDKKVTNMDPLALIAYGCTLPNCKN